MKRRVIAALLIASALIAGGCGSTQNKETKRETPTPQQELKASSEFDFSDKGGEFFTVDIEEFTNANENFRVAVWTGEQMQMTLMSIPVGGDIGEEVHTTIEQFIRIEKGMGEVYIGETQETMKPVAKISDDEIVFIPVGTWHNIKNIGDKPMKLYSIYAPAEHARGTVHVTMEEGHAHDHDH